MSGVTLPGPTVGVVGGGQLGRMLAEAAAPLGVELVVLDPTPTCPASLVARDQLVADFDDQEAITELAERTDVLTYEIELADPAVLAAVRDETGTPVQPAPGTLETIQDKLVQKRTLAEADVPVPAFRPVESPADLAAAKRDLGTPLMLKARTGGYDGRGNRPVEADDDPADALADIGGPAMVEEFVPYERELSVLVGVGRDDSVTFPVTETIHEAEILRETVVPARCTDGVRSEATAVAEAALAELEGRGVFAVELFETAEGTVLVNEIAPRPHNSGHWTIEGAMTSQFEQHVRAVLGWPLGETTARAPTVTTNLLGDVADPRPARLSGVEELLADPAASVHWYGKREARPLRKMGHLTLTDADGDSDELLARARTRRDETTFTEP